MSAKVAIAAVGMDFLDLSFSLDDEEPVAVAGVGGEVDRLGEAADRLQGRRPGSAGAEQCETAMASVAAIRLTIQT